MRDTRRIALYLVLGAIFLAVTVSDWPIQALESFWVAHSMVSGIVSGLLLLALTIFVVEEYLSQRERASWQAVRKIAFQDLGREVMLNQRLLESLVGERDYRQRAARPLSDGPADALHRAVAVALNDSSPELPRDKCLDEVHRNQRLRELYGNGEWCEIAYKCIQYRADDARVTLARWAPVMAGKGRLGTSLETVAQCFDGVETIQIPLVDKTLDHKVMSDEGVTSWLKEWSDYTATCSEVHKKLLPESHNYTK